MCGSAGPRGRRIAYCVYCDWADRSVQRACCVPNKADAARLHPPASCVSWSQAVDDIEEVTMRRAVACVSSFGLMRLRFEVPPGWEHGLRVLCVRATQMKFGSVKGDGARSPPALR